MKFLDKLFGRVVEEEDEPEPWVTRSMLAPNARPSKVPVVVNQRPTLTMRVHGFNVRVAHASLTQTGVFNGDFPDGRNIVLAIMEPEQEIGLATYMTNEEAKNMGEGLIRMADKAYRDEMREGMLEDVSDEVAPGHTVQ